jgi:hypothetical protein
LRLSVKTFLILFLIIMRKGGKACLLTNEGVEIE